MQLRSLGDESLPYGIHILIVWTSTFDTRKQDVGYVGACGSQTRESRTNMLAVYHLPISIWHSGKTTMSIKSGTLRVRLEGKLYLNQKAN